MWAVFSLLGAAGAARSEGYVLNPSGNDATRQIDPEGLSHIRKTRRRTPTGFLYPWPLEPQQLSEIGNGWLAGGSIEIGGITALGDDDETRFERYADWSPSFLLHSVDVALLHEPRALLTEIRGGAIGRDDQYLSAELSRLGRARLRVDHEGIPRTYASDARTLYRGLGSDTLTLASGLTPGNNSDAALIAALDGERERTLSVQRDETRVELDAWLRADTRVTARFELQDRNGERPFGGSWLYDPGFANARAVEIVVPVDDDTYRAQVDLHYGGEVAQATAGYDGSFYRNQHDAVTWDNPFLLPGFVAPEQVERGRHALAPDNDFHNVHASLARTLPWSGRVVLTGSWSRMTQDDDLLPPTVNSGVIGGLDLDQWNTIDALATSSANARVETLLLNGDLSFRPWRRLRLRARARYFDRDSETTYTALNPLTQEFGYVAEDGALATNFGSRQVPVDTLVGEDLRYRATPYGYDTLEIQGQADATLPGRTQLTAGYAWARKGYDERERSSSREHRVRATLSTRALEHSTVRASLRYSHRDGDGYDHDPYDAYFLSGVPGGPAERAFTLAQLRKFDLANRKVYEAQLRWNLLLRADMDLSLAGAFRSIDYGGSYGLQSEQSGSLSADWSYAPSPDFTAHLMGSWERSERDQHTLNDTFFGGGGADPNAGGPLYPLANRWGLDSSQDDLFAGVGLTWRLLARLTLEARYRFIYTRQELDYDFASTGALSLNAPADAGTRFPTLETLEHQLSTSLRLEITNETALRIFYYLQRGEIDDFQQAGLDDPNLLSGVPGDGAGVLFLGHRDRDYTAHVLGATVQLRFF